MVQFVSMKKHEQIQYVEFLSRDLSKVKDFYSKAFGWKFTDYGNEYASFDGEYVGGGFAIGEPVKGTTLVIIYSEALEKTEAKVRDAGGQVMRPIFSFPGGRRFHFSDPDGNELAVWSDK